MAVTPGAFFDRPRRQLRIYAVNSHEGSIPVARNRTAPPPIRSFHSSAANSRGENWKTKRRQAKSLEDAAREVLVLEEAAREEPRRTESASEGRFRTKRLDLAPEDIQEKAIPEEPVWDEPVENEPISEDYGRDRAEENSVQEALKPLDDRTRFEFFVKRGWIKPKDEDGVPPQTESGLDPVKDPAKDPMKQIHVLGADIRGRWIAHALAGYDHIPPVKYLIHRPHMWKRWVDEGQALELYRGNAIERRTRVIGEFIVQDEAAPPGARLSPDDEPIYNLIVTVPAVSVNKSVASLKHRISPLTTICLIQDGLGVGEALINDLFPDPVGRPVILLGHISTTLGYTNEVRQFAVAEIRPGCLYLVAFGNSFSNETSAASGIVSSHPPRSRQETSMRLLRQLVMVPGLYAFGCDWESWLVHKLPDTLFRCVAEPLHTVLNVDYSVIPRNAYARQLMDHVMGELIVVVSRFPELRSKDRFWRMWRAGGLRRVVFKNLLRSRDRFSPMRHSTLRGLQSDADFLLGYFVDRGRDLGVKCQALQSLMWMVKAIHQERFRKARHTVEMVYTTEGVASKRSRYVRRRPTDVGWGELPTEQVSLEKELRDVKGNMETADDEAEEEEGGGGEDDEPYDFGGDEFEVDDDFERELVEEGRIEERYGREGKLVERRVKKKKGKSGKKPEDKETEQEGTGDDPFAALQAEIPKKPKQPKGPIDF